MTHRGPAITFSAWRHHRGTVHQAGRLDERVFLACGTRADHGSLTTAAVTCKLCLKSSVSYRTERTDVETTP